MYLFNGICLTDNLVKNLRRRNKGYPNTVRIEWRFCFSTFEHREEIYGNEY